jgi:hypothetical protein
MQARRSGRGRSARGAHCGRADEGRPNSCPRSLQRIPDVLTGKMPLRSLPRVGRHPAIRAACRARLISDWKAIFRHGSFVKRGRSETLPHRAHRALDLSPCSWSHGGEYEHPDRVWRLDPEWTGSGRRAPIPVPRSERRRRIGAKEDNAQYQYEPDEAPLLASSRWKTSAFWQPARSHLRRC